MHVLFCSCCLVFIIISCAYGTSNNKRHAFYPIKRLLQAATMHISSFESYLFDFISFSWSHEVETNMVLEFVFFLFISVQYDDLIPIRLTRMYAVAVYYFHISLLIPVYFTNFSFFFSLKSKMRVVCQLGCFRKTTTFIIPSILVVVVRSMNSPQRNQCYYNTENNRFSLYLNQKHPALYKATRKFSP